MDPRCGGENEAQADICVHCGRELLLKGSDDIYYVGVEVLGSGAFGAVFGALELVPNREENRLVPRDEVAIKAILPGEVRTAVREEEVLMKLPSMSFFPKYIDSFFRTDVPYLVMEYIDGFTLDELRSAAKSSSLSPQMLFPIILDTFEALAVLHQIGYLHRDIRPTNIMARLVGGRWRAVLFDFGLSKKRQHEELIPERSGTWQYIAPEHRSGKENCRADIFSLGMTAAECLGVPDLPFKERSGKCPTFRRTLEQRGIHKDVIKFLELCTLYDVQDRMSNCTVSGAHLRKLLRDRRVSSLKRDTR